MVQRAGPGTDGRKDDPTGVVIDATGPPVLNPAAAGVLLRILLRAAEQNGLTNATHPDARRVRSDS